MNKFTGVSALGLAFWVYGAWVPSAYSEEKTAVPAKKPTCIETAEIDPDTGNPNVRKFMSSTPDCKGVMIWTTNKKSSYQPSVDICEAVKSSTQTKSLVRGCEILTLHPNEKEAKVGHMPTAFISADQKTLRTYRIVNNTQRYQDFTVFIDTVGGPNDGAIQAVKFAEEASGARVYSAPELERLLEERKRSQALHKSLRERFGAGTRAAEAAAGAAIN